MTERKKVTIDIRCGGFAFEINGERFWFSQEEEQPEELWKKIFKELDIDIVIKESY
jgi:hypothetical protein